MQAGQPQAWWDYAAENACTTHNATSAGGETSPWQKRFDNNWVATMVKDMGECEGCPPRFMEWVQTARGHGHHLAGSFLHDPLAHQVNATTASMVLYCSRCGSWTTAVMHATQCGLLRLCPGNPSVAGRRALGQLRSRLHPVRGRLPPLSQPFDMPL